MSYGRRWEIVPLITQDRRHTAARDLFRAAHRQITPVAINEKLDFTEVDRHVSMRRALT